MNEPESHVLKASGSNPLPLMLRAFLLLLVTTCSACALVGLDPDGERIVLVNDSGEPIHFFALELELSHRVDPVGAFPPDAVPFPRIAPGASIEVDSIAGYEPGDDVRFFLYALRQGREEGPRVVLLKLLTATHRELAASGGRVHAGSL